MVKIALLAPIPRASVATAVPAKSGERRRERSATRRSAHMLVDDSTVVAHLAADAAKFESPVSRPEPMTCGDHTLWMPRARPLHGITAKASPFSYWIRALAATGP